MPDLSTDSTAGAPVGEAGAPAVGIPVVDLTTLVRDLYTEADRCREDALALSRVIASQRRQADLLEALAGVLSGDA